MNQKLTSLYCEVASVAQQLHWVMDDNRGNYRLHNQLNPLRLDLQAIMNMIIGIEEQLEKDSQNGSC